MNNDWSHFNVGFSLKLVFESHEGNRSLCLYWSIRRQRILSSSGTVEGIKMVMFPSSTTS